MSTLDGKKISMGMEGFNIYSTSTLEPNEKPAPIMTVTDVLERLSALELIINNTELTRYIKLLSVHVQLEDNPHNTQLVQFEQTVIDLLYSEYQNAGGTGTLEYYTECLFKPLSVATISDLLAGEAKEALVSVVAADTIIKQHESDVNAHEAAIDHLLPGESIETYPYLAVKSNFGIPAHSVNISAENLLLYTITTPNGYIKQCTSKYDIIDWSQYGRATIPCFGPRINLLRNSTDFNIHTPVNVTNVIGDESRTPMRTNGVTIVTAETDTFAVNHGYYINLAGEGETAYFNLAADTPTTFSVFAKSLECRYLSISHLSDPANNITSRAIFDLQEGTVLVTDHSFDYVGRITKYAERWYRCEFSMYSASGSNDPVVLTFFKEYDEEDEFAFIGSGESCAQVWGAQLEYGLTASPYIATAGEPVMREPLDISFEIDSFEEATIYVSGMNPNTTKNDDSKRAFVSMVNDDDLLVMSAYIDKNGLMTVSRYEVVLSSGGTLKESVETHFDVFETTDNVSNLTSSLSLNGIVNTYNFNSINTHHTPNITRPTKIILGGDGKNNYFEGYINAMTYYPCATTSENAIFLNTGV